MHLITWNYTIFNNVNVSLVSRICRDYILFKNYISGFSKLLNWGTDLFTSRGGKKRTPIFFFTFPEEKSIAIWLIKPEIGCHHVSSPTVKLNTNWKRRTTQPVWKRNTGKEVEIWRLKIYGESWPVTPQVTNNPPLNKQQSTDMASCTSLYFNLSLERYTLPSITNWKRMKAEMSPGETCMIQSSDSACFL